MPGTLGTEQARYTHTYPLGYQDGPAAFQGDWAEMEPKLREEIDALYHKNVATGQLEVHERLEQVTHDLVEKANELLERDGPHRRVDIEDAAKRVLAIIHVRLRQDLKSFIEYQKIEKDLRNNALTIFVRSHEEARSRCAV